MGSRIPNRNSHTEFRGFLIVSVPEVGTVYDGTVKSIKEFGAFVEFLPKKEGLLHISEISWKRLETMDGVLKEGDKIQFCLDSHFCAELQNNNTILCGKLQIGI